MFSSVRSTAAVLAAVATAAVCAAPASAGVAGQSSCIAFFATYLDVQDLVYVAQNTPALGENGKVFFAQQKTDGLC